MSKIMEILERSYWDANTPPQNLQICSIWVNEAHAAIIDLIFEKMPKEEQIVKHDETGEKCGCKYFDEEYPCEMKQLGRNSALAEMRERINSL